MDIGSAGDCMLAFVLVNPQKTTVFHLIQEPKLNDGQDEGHFFVGERRRDPRPPRTVDGITTDAMQQYPEGVWVAQLDHLGIFSRSVEESPSVHSDSRCAARG